jgi:hypothetical protein
LHERTHGDPLLFGDRPETLISNFGAGYPNLEAGVNLLRSRLTKLEGVGMAHDYTRNLQFDRRLLRRRGWVDSEELEKELADLPDVSHKAQLPGEDNEPSSEPEEPPPQDSNQPD